MHGDHVPAQNQSALMLPLIFKTMLQHTEYLYTYKKVILLFFQLFFPIFSNKSIRHPTSTQTKSCSKVPGLLPFYYKIQQNIQRTQQRFPLTFWDLIEPKGMKTYLRQRSYTKNCYYFWKFGSKSKFIVTLYCISFSKCSKHREHIKAQTNVE